MNRSRTLATTVALALLATGSLTGCGADSTEQPRSMSTTSEIDGGPTSGIRSRAASAAPSAPDEAQQPAGGSGAPSGTRGSGDRASTPAPAASSPEPKNSCATTSAQQAVDENIGKVPAAFPDGTQNVDWMVQDSDNYDPCAELSWVTLVIEGATVSSPYTQMLFHHGEYLGTTTSKAIGFSPSTVRLDDATIQVTYRYVEASESNAEARGRAVSTYTWNPDTESIDHAGEWPPGIG